MRGGRSYGKHRRWGHPWGCAATLPPGAGVMIPGRREAVTVLRGPYTLQAVSVMA